VLRTLSGRHALTPKQRRFPLIVLIAVNVIVISIIVGAAVASNEQGFRLFMLFLVLVALIEMAYKVMKLFRVTEIDPAFVASLVPLRFLSWRIEASEIQRIDLELGDKEDTLRLVTKTSGKRRLPIPRAVGSRLRSSPDRGA